MKGRRERNKKNEGELPKKLETEETNRWRQDWNEGKGKRKKRTKGTEGRE